jgi:hypothetical protein
VSARRRNCRRSRACPENIRKPYAQATEPVDHTNSMRSDSYYCRGLSSSVVAALSAKNRKRTLRVDFDRLIRGCVASRDAERSDCQISHIQLRSIGALSCCQHTQYSHLSRPSFWQVNQITIFGIQFRIRTVCLQISSDDRFSHVMSISSDSQFSHITAVMPIYSHPILINR